MDEVRREGGRKKGMEEGKKEWKNKLRVKGGEM